MDTESPPAIPSLTKKDREHLRLLGIFYFVYAGFFLLGIAFLFVHYTMMTGIMDTAMDAAVEQARGEGADQLAQMESERAQVDQIMGFIVPMYVVGGIVMVIGGVLNVIAGRCLLKRTGRMFTQVLAGFNCLNIPLGTLLGVFTFLVLGRETVREAYEKGES